MLSCPQKRSLSVVSFHGGADHHGACHYGLWRVRYGLNFMRFLSTMARTTKSNLCQHRSGNFQCLLSDPYRRLCGQIPLRYAIPELRLTEMRQAGPAPIWHAPQRTDHSGMRHIVERNLIKFRLYTRVSDRVIRIDE